MRRHLHLVAAAIVGACLALPAHAGDMVQVRGAEHDEGYARIAVEWPAPVAFEAKLDGDTLTIHFARAFSASLTPLSRALDHYVASVGQSADGTSIVATLKKPVEIKTKTVNGTIASIDLVAHSATPEKAAAKTVAAPGPAVKAGSRKDGAQAAASPKTATPPTAETSPGTPTTDVAKENAAKSGQPSPPSGAPVNLFLPSAFDTAGAAAPIPPAVAAAAESAKAPQLEPAAAHAADKVQVRGAEHLEGFARIAVEWPTPIGFDAKIDGDTLTVHFARPFTASLTPLVHQIDHYVTSVAQSPDGTSIIARLKKSVEIKRTTVNGTIASIDLVTRPAEKAGPKVPPAKLGDTKKSEPVKSQRPASQQPAKDEVAAPPRAAALAAAPPNAVTPPALSVADTPPLAPAESFSAGDNGGTITPVLTLDNGRASLRFDWPSPTAAAVYRRGPATWIVFGSPSTLDLTAVRQRGQAILRAADQMRADGATALRLITADGINPSVRRSGNAWIIDLKRQDATADAPITIDARPAGPQPSVELHVRDAATPLHLRDPILGDRLIIVPVGEIGRGIDATRDFVDFRLLPTLQGVVIRPNADDLEVKSDADVVHITRRRGLVLSDVRDRLLGRAVANHHRIFDFAGWRGPAKQSFTERRGILERAIASTGAGARTRTRIDLARFYFANSFGPEALSVLAQIARDDAQAAADPPLRAMKGAACLLAGNDDCAAVELGQTSLDDEPEAGLWRGSLAATKGDWPTASREFLRGVSLLSTYPKALRNRFALQAAETLLESDRGAGAGPLVDMVLRDSPELGDRAMALYLQGRIEQQLGQLDQALQHWAQVAAMNDRKARARALYARAMALYETKRVSGIDTIKTLDAMRFAWRGDNFEFTLLRRLGELKLAEHDVEGGLEALQLAASYFPDYPAVNEVSREAIDAFADVFVGKAAEDVPPVKALALYDTFHDLEPTGERHDAIVKKLIDRLVSVDLLDRAATLLGNQVKSVAGTEKARAATQLALLRLMNQQPDAAIAALDIDVNAGLTPDLTRQRQQLRARALMDLNRSPEAIAILANDNTRDANRLRADIYWRQRDWKNAARIFATLAGQPPAQGPLDPDGARLVLNWAAALTLDGDQPGLARLRQDFGPSIAGTQVAQAFNVIAGDTADSGAGTPTEIANRVAQIGVLQNFMSAYRQRLASTKLSAIN
jgi:tetratricopeptide (TPR) repeat protein